MSTLPTTVLDEPRIREKGKGYLRRSAFFVPFALGIRENTRMTVTPSEALFANLSPIFCKDRRYAFSTGAWLPSFLVIQRTFTKKEKIL